MMSNYYLFIIFRFITGIGVGGEYTAIFAAIDEFIPPRVRGFTNIVIDGTWHFGILFIFYLLLLFFIFIIN